MLRMVSYPHRPQSGHITCYLNRTYHVLPTRSAAAPFRKAPSVPKWAQSGGGDSPLLSGNCGMLRAGVRLGTLAGAAYAPVRGFFGAGLRALHIRENPTSRAWGPGISLPEFVCARRASVFRADYLRMKHILCLLLLISGALLSFAAESTFLVRK